MQRRIPLLVIVTSMTLFSANTAWADVPAPPVNQTIGMEDVAAGTLGEADCRVCHSSGVPDRHHLLYGQPIPSGTVVPFPDADGDGTPDTTYGCLNCHDQDFTVVRDCTVCHTTSAHHTTPAAQAGDCVSCHGDIVDNMDDGHYIPTYAPSQVTPSASGGDGLPLNSRNKGAGACDYCHDDDGLPTPVILTNAQLHHSTGVDCMWCHAVHGPPTTIRVCEGCHGPDSLHSIQADSPNPDNIGTIVVGGEDAGYGHVGRDAGPGDSDCWGCHGFAMASAPGSGPTVPTIRSSDATVINAGTDTMVILSGSAFTNTAGDILFESNVALTAADGSSVILTPDVLLQDMLTVTIPGDTAAGNYELRAVKADVASNPVVLSIVPAVIITDATFDGIVTINGSGFGGYAEGSGTSVTGTITTGNARKNTITTTTVEAAVITWSDTLIEAYFGARPNQVTVHSIFGTCASEVARHKNRRARKRGAN